MSKTKHTEGKLKIGINIFGSIGLIDEKHKCLFKATNALGQISDDEQDANAARLVRCWNMHDELVDVVKTTKAFFDSMPKGQFGKISCDIGLMNSMFIGITNVLKQSE